MTGVDSGNHAAKSEREEALTRHKKTPERFLVPGPFRSAGAFIEIAVDLMPTSVFPVVPGFFFSPQSCLASRVPKAKISSKADG
jgi:hypothetical protein